VTSNIADIAPRSLAMRTGLIGERTRGCSRQLEMARDALQRSAFLVAAMHGQGGDLFKGGDN